MSNPDLRAAEPRPTEHRDGPGDSQSSGPNLVLIYSLLVLALIAAIGFAALIVLPFYHRR
jgi:hypothetical protein